MRTAIFTNLFCAALLAATASAWALESAPQTSDYATLKLMTDAEGTGSAPGFQAGLSIALQPGWHSFWRMPGEGGLPPKFDWSGSKNVASATVRWPAPQRIDQMGMYSFGYTGNVMLPVDVTLKTPGQAATLDLKADLMVCKDSCIPQHFALSIAVPAGPAKPSPDSAALATAVKTLPHQGNTAGLKIENVVIGPKALVVMAHSQNGFDSADLFVEIPGGMFYFTAPPVITPDAKDPRNATISLIPPDGTGNLANALMHHKVVLTLVKDNASVAKTIEF
jgi:suppressor for copper-sensitivity B